MLGVVNEYVEIAPTGEPGKHHVALIDPDLGPDAPPGVEFQLDPDSFLALHYALRDYKLLTEGYKRVEVEAKDLKQGDIIYEFGVAVFKTHHVVGEVAVELPDIDDFVIVFCGVTGLTMSFRLPLLHKVTINRRLEEL